MKIINLNNTYFKEGFTLLEVTLGFSILVIALAGIYSALIVAQIYSKVNREIQIATFACHKEMECLLAEDWDTILTKNGEKIYVPGLKYPPGSDSNGEIDIDTTYISQNIIIIKVTVRWLSFGGKVKNITLKTFLEKK